MSDDGGGSDGSVARSSNDVLDVSESAKTARRSHARTPSSARTAADLVASTRVVAGALVRTNLDTLRDVIANKNPGAGSTLGNVDRRFFSRGSTLGRRE